MKYFKPSEFVCKCCGRGELQPSTIEKMDMAREIAGIPFYVNSAFRCEAHNRAVGGKQNSAHTRGYAVDIKCNRETKKVILEAVKQAGFRRIGLASNFIHVDDDPSLHSPTTWTY